MTDIDSPEDGAEEGPTSLPERQSRATASEAAKFVAASSESPESSSASALGAQAAFQLNSAALAHIQKQIEETTQYQSGWLSNAQTIARVFDQAAIAPETLRSLANVSALAGQLQIPAEALASIASNLDAVTRFNFSEEFWEQFRTTARLLNESTSIPSFYTSAQLTLRETAQKTGPRPDRTAESFFDEFSVDVTDVRSMLRAVTAIQEKHHMHRLVWRGQQSTAWPVHSSLYRKLEASSYPSEESLIAAEVTGMQHATNWGEDTTPAMKFFAGLQHYGAPTRLLDATVDPEIATWFAIEANPTLDEEDGRVIAWGRSTRISTRKVSAENDSLPARHDAPFWHSWTTDQERGRVGWGTGTKTWSWFPPALSDRMRAQRAGFLLEAAPLVTPTAAAVLSGGVSQDWRVSEITRATSIVGLPSRHDVRTVPNEAHLVPLFSLRILSRAKPEIREYLEKKGLSFSTVYPDRAGLVSYLKGPFGLKI